MKTGVDAGFSVDPCRLDFGPSDPGRFASNLVMVMMTMALFGGSDHGRFDFWPKRPWSLRFGNCKCICNSICSCICICDCNCNYPPPHFCARACLVRYFPVPGPGPDPAPPPLVLDLVLFCWILDLGCFKESRPPVLS